MRNKSGLLIFKVLRNNKEASRVGFVVSKKISTKATIRNKIKRRLRYAVDSYLPSLKMPTDIVIIVLPGIEKKDFSQLQTMIGNAFKKWI